MTTYLPVLVYWEAPEEKILKGRFERGRPSEGPQAGPIKHPYSTPCVKEHRSG